MENRPPQQETPRRPPTNSGRKTNGSGGSPTPPWLWLLLLGGFRPDLLAVRAQAGGPVLYYPWFYEQVQADNIKSITIQGDEIRGELRKAARLQKPGHSKHGQRHEIHHLSAVRQSLIQIVQTLIQHEREKLAEKKAEEQARRAGIRRRPKIRRPT